MFDFDFGLLGLDIPVWIILVVCCIVLIYIYGTYPGTIWKNLGVPSPPSAPFIGHMHQIYDPQTGMCGSIKKWTKQYGNIFGVLIFRDPVLIVTCFEAVKEILVKDFSNYSDRYLAGYNALWQPIMKKGILFNRGHDWKRIRRIMSPSFSSGKLKLLTHYINSTACQLVDALDKHVEEGSHPEAKVVFSAFSLDVLAGTAFGLELDSQNNVNGSFYQHAKGLATFKKSLQVILGIVGMFPFLSCFFRMLNIGFFNSCDVRYFEEQLTRLVSERKSNPEKFKDVDFLQFLINAEANSTEDLMGSKKLKTEEIVAQSIIFVLAGYDTTSSTLQWLTYELSKNRDVQQRMRKEIDNVIGDDEEVCNEHCQKLKYMEAVIHETLRMYPPVVSLSRLSNDAATLQGFNVPAKAGILIPIFNLCRDPDLFEDPNTFNPDRFADEDKIQSSLLTFLPFGCGPRQCIGVRLAMLQLKIALVHVLKRFSIDSATPSQVDIDDFTGLLIPKQKINLILSKYNM